MSDYSVFFLYWHFIAYLKCFSGTNTIITTQLSIALSDLILQMPSWQRAPLDLINRFSNHSYIWPLIEVLTVLPEEIENRSVR